eukprot:CAMPEP_0114148654 /NCGR_PEP_ID=MMETSP0043_2-20121206/21749_1 /TAXON_ID=464988 /ORGANISM="Hemiselmis andersenii, Strain CCMP644" /LENGTH=352 /DNA_ID=CAMNT_0001243261 /DNA_START=146 /DNA_END=1204 /DNA_ORIENTATION=-
MPVGKKELERWSNAQKARNRAGSAMSEMVRAAHASGTLNLSNRQLSEIPEELLRYNEADAQENWWEVAELRKLDISHNTLSSLPDALFQPLTELQVLHVGNNGISSLPRSLSTCGGALSRLNLAYNKFQSLPPWVFEELPLLTHISLDHNLLSALPPSLGALAHADTISASNNCLTSIPEIMHLGSLRTFILASNRISTLPDSIGSLHNLEHLELGHNRLSTLPGTIASLSSLVRLDARENALSHIPAIPRSHALAELLLGFNKLNTLPPTASESAPQLAVVDLRDNAIDGEDVVHNLLPLRSLRALDLRNNELRGLPAELGLKTTVTSLLLEGNPIKAIRRAILAGMCVWL